MMMQRIFGLLLVWLEAAVAAYLFKSYWFYPAVAVLAGLGVFGWIRIPLSRERRLIAALVLAFAAAIEWRLVLMGRSTESVVFGGNTGLNEGFAQYFLLLQAALFFLAPGQRISPVLVLFGAVVFAATGDFMERYTAPGPYRAASLTFVVLAAGFLALGRETTATSLTPTRRLRTLGLNGAVLLVALALAWSVSSLLHTYQPQLDNAFANIVVGLPYRGALGFSNEARLGSLAELSERDGGSPALRVYASKSPGYLRGIAYDVYRPPFWDVSAARTRALPARDGMDGLDQLEPGLRLFRLDERHPADWSRSMVWPEVASGGYYFTSIETAAIATPVAELSIDTDRNVLSTSQDSVGRYELLAPADGTTAARAPLSPEERQRLCALPANLDPRIGDLARGILEGKTTVSEKIQAVTQYFATNYQYHLGITIPRGEDPLTYFLLERPPGHCEYFASGAAVLLRLGGVPCRYVTGFMAEDFNSLGGYWLARNEDAHAWVEAYDDEAGKARWVTVEATVADGLPDARRHDTFPVAAHLWDYAKFCFADIRDGIVRGEWRRVLVACLTGPFFFLKRMLGEHPEAGIALIVAAAGFLFIRRRKPRHKRPAMDPRVRELNRLLSKMDRRVKRRKLVRRPSETLHRFAARIRREADKKTQPNDRAFLQCAATWYIEFAARRYAPPVGPSRS